MACPVTYWTAILAYILITEMKISQFTKKHSETVLFCELRIVNGKDMKIFFSLCLTQAEKVKAYLLAGTRKLSVEANYPNPTLGFGALCLRDSFRWAGANV